MLGIQISCFTIQQVETYSDGLYILLFFLSEVCTLLIAIRESMWLRFHAVVLLVFRLIDLRIMV